jgi:hypothetical protein
MADVAYLCDCNFDKESNVIGLLCKYCKIKDDKLRESQWYEQVKIIKKYLILVENTRGSENKIPIVKTMFEYLLTQHIFIAKNPGFRKAVISKVDEFRTDENIDILLPVFDKFSIFIEELKNHQDYV